MDRTIMLSRLYAAREEWDRGADAGMVLDELIQDLQQEEREATYKMIGGKPKTLATMKKIIKNAEKNGSAINGAVQYENFSYITDGFRAIRIHGDVPIQKCTKSGSLGKSLHDIMERAIEESNSGDIAPNYAEVKQNFEQEKAHRKANGIKTDRYNPILFQVNKNTWVNAQYLLEMMEALPGCEIYAVESDLPCSRKPIYFKSDAGDGVLLPVNHT